ncbi:hypothetical protein A2875_00945 [Candidatus Gottesmanbacteria bacterium RIFCSPHIGHO2_01_FULL_46_14]|uniref:Glycosyltransferase subfamily 4-like N-terminal domain-containing protein n=1 Tax=Candidatus Gottesmanbacteria bacterium RIFCSPHIGHO2_01_FULL_46_14 TaxID=1798380 RepID=A0A1F5ZNZ9_9BACT|nr:MAG: hypothetical protein A2875_00945 [Candidatus Gottesmanbacteria bacterium RIFCSPHIGHO2_01_FULL_46_14]
MNILVITATYPPSVNGVAISTQRTVLALKKRGHTVFVLGPGEFLTLHNVPFAPKDYPIIFPFLLSSIKERLARTSWDIIHVHHPSVIGSLAVSLGKRLGVPVVFTYHTQYDRYIDTYAPFLPKALRRSIYIGALAFCREVQAIIAPTHWLEGQLRERFPEVPVYYVSTAGLPKIFALKTPKSALRRQLGLPENLSIFLTVSRLSKEKNLAFLIGSFAIWSKRNRSGLLVIVGDGSERSSLRKLAVSHSMDKSIRFVGKIPNQDLATWYSASDVFLYSSTTDTIGVNIIEAMSAGLPVVSIDDTTTREVIRSKVNGILVPPKEEAFAKAMALALEQKKRLASESRDTAGAYMLEATTQALERVYRTIIQSR